MQFWNRITRQTSTTLPEHLLLGQWQILTEAESTIINTVQILPQSRVYIFPDTTKRWSLRLSNENRQVRTFPAWQIPSDLLIETICFFEQKRQELRAENNSWDNWVSVPPLVPDIRETIRPQPLEELIQKHLGHIEEICHHPRTYLKMESDRLPISRAQRISPHATEFLASHTEDWEKRTIHKIRPKRVLCLIREDMLDIYENRVTVRLIDHLLEYLQKRIWEVQALQKELEQINDFSSKTHNIHWRNRKRICSLWGEHFQDVTALKTTEKTLNILRQLQYKLRGLMDTELYRAIPKQAEVGNTLKRTNILINDQHYRYVDRIWQALNPWKRGKAKNNQQIFDSYEQLFKGFESFCLLLISRALTGSGNENDEGLGFEAETHHIPHPGEVIQFNSCQGKLTLTWQEEGTFLVQSDNLQNLRLIPLLTPLTVISEDKLLSNILKNLKNDCNPQNESIVILYPGIEEERQQLAVDLQRQVYTLGNDCFVGEISLALVPVSPLEVISVERIARTLQWWFYSQQYQAYPYLFTESLPHTLLEQTEWIIPTEKHEHKILRPLRPEEQGNFNERLSKLINQVKAKGPLAKGELNKLQQLEALPNQIQNRFKPLLFCPTCHKLTDNFTPLESQCFHCSCNECKSEWGTRICKNCDARYPYIQVSGRDNTNSSFNRKVGWIDQVFGRNTLAIPCWNTRDNDSFICPSCGVCSHSINSSCETCIRCIVSHVEKSVKSGK
ncbi:hypothetical protein NIES21_57230 (plasmid) [Anabaenopsis circularis NIES-21]|uniref:DUF2357 domain-containing protein n=1 Tax=Anabaenopsis circularis NIES-21 TaxID=1085406 RepID=A0A1Z4GQU1_9CYAN|nr:hypothetical protein NIES21_57230 [Anabaenopsis circularis NIES-21]